MEKTVEQARSLRDQALKNLGLPHYWVARGNDLKEFSKFLNLKNSDNQIQNDGSIFAHTYSHNEWTALVGKLEKLAGPYGYAIYKAWQVNNS